MHGLLEALYDADTREQVISLYENSNSEDRLTIRATVSQALQDTPRILTHNGADWLLCTLCRYDKSVNETMRVYQTLARYVTDADIMVGMLETIHSENQIELRIPEHNELADACLMMVSLFPEHLERKQRRYGAPSVKWYSQVGALAFSRAGHADVAQHFDGWSSFINQEIPL